MRALALLLVLLAAPAAQTIINTASSKGKSGGGRAPHAASAARVAAPAGVNLSVATFNLNASRTGDAATLDAAAALDADVIMFQECSPGWARALRTRLAGRYPFTVFENLEQPYGASGVLSKVPIVGHRVLPKASGAFPALLAEVEVAGRRLSILNVHLYPPSRLVKKLGWLRAYWLSQSTHRRELEEHLAQLREHPDVIVGDFNEDELGMGVRWLQSLGYSTSLSTRTNTWRWETGHGEIRWPLDHVMVDRDVQVVSARVVHAGGSDHLPVISNLHVEAPIASVTASARP